MDKIDIIEDLKVRGMLDSFSDEQKIRELLKTPQTIYCGFDPSAKSMQLGNFIMITILRKLQQAGHRIIALVGGATGMIGDPSGKAAERTFLGADSVFANAKCLAAQLSKYLDFSSPEKGILLNNYDWWSKINVIEFLRDYGKQIPVNYMLAKELVKKRLETSGISYTEFSYMILQSGDFYNLRKKYGCTIQIGGGDQWGNLTTALEFCKRREGPECPCQVFSVKLITDSNGKKFGKSEKGALYLDPSMTSPFDIYQYFINVPDADVGRFLYIFSPDPIEKINEIIKKHMENPGLRTGQKALARIVTTLVHGEKVADRCEEMTAALFSGDFNRLTADEALELAHSLGAPEVEDNFPLLDALVNTKLASSKSEARRFVSSAAVSINGNKITDIAAKITRDQAIGGKIVFIRRGKKSNGALIIK